MPFCLWIPNIVWNESGNLVSLRSKYKWLERLTGWLTQAMHHSWWKFTYISRWTFSEALHKKKAITIVNKRVLRLSILFVCLVILTWSCSMSWDKRYPGATLNNAIITCNDFNLNLLCGSSWIASWRGTFIQGAWDIQPILCQAHYSFAFTLNFNHSRCYDRGNESSTPMNTTLQTLT